MKVAFSASFSDVPLVKEVLDSCDVIYTSNINYYPTLKEMFGDKVRVIMSPTAITLLMKEAEEEGCEIVTFGDLMRLKEDYISPTCLHPKRYRLFK